MRKTISFLLAAVSLFFLAVPVAAVDISYTVTIRIEGISGNLYYATVSVPVTDGALSAKEALAYVDSQNDTITITGLDTNYITAVNGETAGTYGGWDGWSYRVNGAEPSVGIADYTVYSGDSIVLYYGDPFGIGMQYPALDLSRLGIGILRVISSDTTYDSVTWEPVVTVKPVAGALVTWGYGESTVQYTTDDNGCITLGSTQFFAGVHSIQIEKYADNGCPLVLRGAPDRTVTLTDTITPLNAGDDSPIIADRANGFLILRTGSETVGELTARLEDAAFIFGSRTSGGSLSYLQRDGALHTGAYAWIMNQTGATDSLIVVAAGETDSTEGLGASDARAALRFAAGLDAPTAVQFAAADLDQNGEITVPEACMILRVAAGIDVFEIEH